MIDSKRVLIKGRAVPVRGNDIDTDRIIPARFLKTVTFEGLGDHAFEDDRIGLKNEGKTHPFDEARFQEATVLITNKNFGCGSSREHAPQSLNRWNKGLQVVIGESFAEIFYGNCQSLGVPCPVVTPEVAEALMKAVEADPALELSVDLDARTITAGKTSYEFSMPEGPRMVFLEGSWDSTAGLLSGANEIKKVASRLPYINDFS
jgi:3-isopropylmalate/(R)-2-methylmalate dehydratase small subunit